MHVFIRCSDCKQLKQSFAYYTIFVFFSLNLTSWIFCIITKSKLHWRAGHAKEMLTTCAAAHSSQRVDGSAVDYSPWTFLNTLPDLLRNRGNLWI